MEHYQSNRTVSYDFQQSDAGARDSQEEPMDFLRDRKINFPTCSAIFMRDAITVAGQSAIVLIIHQDARETYPMKCPVSRARQKSSFREICSIKEHLSLLMRLLR